MPQRVFPRIRTAVPVTVSFGGMEEAGRIENASQRGMRIRALRAPAMGELVSADVRLPSGTTTRIEGKVVFRDESPTAEGIGFAIELTHPNEEFAALLGLLVAANVRRGTIR